MPGFSYRVIGAMPEGWGQGAAKTSQAVDFLITTNISLPITSIWMNNIVLKQWYQFDTNSDQNGLWKLTEISVFSREIVVADATEQEVQQLLIMTIDY